MTDRRVAIGVVALGIALAAYAGFRMPNSWAATLDAVSLFGGFHRRFLVGTLLHPLAAATGYDYWVFATWSFVVLAVLLGIVAVVAVRARSPVQRLMIVAWLVFAGGFLFNEVGYFDQVLYVLLFASIWLVHRDRIVPAVVVMSLAPFVHEIAILTVLPMFGLVLLRNVPFRRAAIATAIPTILNLILFALPAASDGAVERLEAHLWGTNFVFRLDALLLFQSSTSFDYRGVAMVVRPMLIVLLVAFTLWWLSDRGSWLGKRDRQRESIVFVTSAAAIGLPFLLCYGGWDANRWMFLLFANFVIVVWLAIEYRPGNAISVRTISVLAGALLFAGHADITYFEHQKPRDLGYSQVHRFVTSALDGTLFEPPSN